MCSLGDCYICLSWKTSHFFSFMLPQLYDKYQDFVTEPEKEQLSAKLQEVEDWLYDEGEDETKGVYVAKLEELKKVGFCLDLWCISFVECLFA